MISFKMTAGATFDEVLTFSDQGEPVDITGTTVSARMILDRSTGRAFTFETPLLVPEEGICGIYASASATEELVAGRWRGDMAVRLGDVVIFSEEFIANVRKGISRVHQD